MTHQPGVYVPFRALFLVLYLSLIYLHILYIFVVLFDAKEFYSTL